jgi:hypothetical protein
MGTTVKKILHSQYNIWEPCWANKDIYGFAGMFMVIGALRNGNTIYAPFQKYTLNIRDTYITKYDGTKWDDVSTFVVSSNITGSMTTSDGHGGPSIARSFDGHLHVFSGCHDNQCAYGYSTNPDDISAWTDVENRITGSTKADACSYPVPFVAPDTGRMVLLFRDTAAGTHYHLAQMHSDDYGVTWTTRTDFYDDVHPTYDIGGSNYWWPYHVSGPIHYVSYISGDWYIEYNWNARVQYNTPY